MIRRQQRRSRVPGPINPVPTAWTPADISTALWLDAADSTTITESSGSVSEWRDKSGNTLHVTQSTGSAQPTLSTFGSRTALSFDGSNDNLTNATTGITSGTYSGELTVFYVATRSGDGGTILTERNAALVASSQWALIAGDRYLSSDGANFGSNHTIASGVYDDLATGGAVICHQHAAGSRDNLWVTGTSRTVDTGTASNISGTAGFSIGSREGVVGQNWNGIIAEIVVVTDTLTTTTRELVEGYLAWRWGLQGSLPGGHPYSSVAP